MFINLKIFLIIIEKIVEFKRIFINFKNFLKKIYKTFAINAMKKLRRYGGNFKKN